MKPIKTIVRKLKRIYYTNNVKIRCNEYGVNLTVNRKSGVNSNLHLGNNVNFNRMVIKDGGKVIIGNNFHSGLDCLMIPRFHNYDNGETIPYDQAFTHKDILIGDNVWIGDRVIILGGVQIGEGVIIQAGSCVVSDIPDYAIAGGHPAKVFKYRDIKHYNKLKNKKAFN